MKLHIGCCGWSYLQPFAYKLRKPFVSTLQAYAQLFDCVEINSTFYRIPKLSTAVKWYKEAKKVNKRFVFSVKASQIITHLERFASRALGAFEQLKTVCEALDAKALLFQTPAGFGPTKANIASMQRFFGKVNRGKLIFVWEPRGRWLSELELVKKVCKELELVHCVDPFRNDPQHLGRARILYFRLHGFGRSSMYNYNFSFAELKQLANKLKTTKAKEAWTMFNNTACYENALEFRKIVKA